LEPETPDIATAEAKLASATKLLNLMKAHHKGAPPPHSSAAQQIQAQQRVVETARLKLEQARRLQPASVHPEKQAA
jgi:outer membrane protein TolC